MSHAQGNDMAALNSDATERSSNPPEGTPTTQELRDIRMLNDSRGYPAILKFASELTTRVRELDRMEREYLIVPGEGTKILTNIIESYVYTVIQTLRRQEQGNDLPSESLKPRSGDSKAHPATPETIKEKETI